MAGTFISVSLLNEDFFSFLRGNISGGWETEEATDT